MASDEMKHVRSNFTKEGINNAQLATVQVWYKDSKFKHR